NANEGSHGLHFLLQLSMVPPVRSYSPGGRASATGEILPRCSPFDFAPRFAELRCAQQGRRSE
ncbi:MAG: hypothetical protein AAF804_13665, partial [Bacteroidota bacterium]